jgi:hypothetical protein
MIRDPSHETKLFLIDFLQTFGKMFQIPLTPAVTSVIVISLSLSSHERAMRARESNLGVRLPQRRRPGTQCPVAFQSV